MSAWRNLAALGLLVSTAAVGCVFSSGDGDDDDDTGGSGGTPATGGKSGAGGSTGGAGGSGGSTGGSGGSTGGTGGGGGTGGTMIMCNPDAAPAESCSRCVEGPTCCSEFETCANNAFCGFNPATEENEMRCNDACKQAICLGRRPDLSTCDAATVATEVTPDEAMECASFCRPENTPSAGEFMCTLGCMQAATFVLQGVVSTTPVTCAAGCMSENSPIGTIQPATSALIGCIVGEDTTEAPGCAECGVSPTVE